MATYAGLTKAAKHFDVSRSLFYKLEAQGKIKLYRGLGSKVLVDLDEINSKISVRPRPLPQPTNV